MLTPLSVEGINLPLLLVLGHFRGLSLLKYRHYFKKKKCEYSNGNEI